MDCTCPVCGQTALYPPRYAYKWHVCQGGCGPAVGTRLRLVPGGMGTTAQQAEERWRRGIARGRARRWAVAAVGAALLSAPWSAPLLLGVHPARVAVLVLAGVGGALAVLGTRAARTFWLEKPAGL